MIILTDRQRSHGQIKAWRQVTQWKGTKKCQGEWNHPKQSTDSCRKDQVEQFLLPTNGSHKLLSRIQVEYKNMLQKYII